MSRDVDRRKSQELERRLREQERRSRQSVVEEEKVPPKKIPPDTTRPMIDLVRVDVDPSEILSRPEIDAVIAPYLGKMVSLADLYAIVASIDALYRERGYITAKANLPPQKVSEGVVRIQLIEARVGAVRYEGNRFTRKSFLDRRLPFSVGQLVDVKQAELLLRRFNRLNDVLANLVLSPGEKPGSTDLRLKIEEPPQLVVDLALDNYGPSSTGTSRRGLSVSTPSLSGLRDPLAVGGYVSEGAGSVYFSYEIPLTASDTRLAVNADYNQTEALVPLSPTERFRFDGEAYSASATLSHPLFVSAQTLMRGFVSGTRRRSDTDVVGAGLRLSKTDLWTAEGGVSAERQDQSGYWVVTTVLKRVFDRVDDADGFLKASGSVTRQQRLVPGVWATARLNGQVVGQSGVVAAEAFQAGGAFTVRGYPEAYTLSDHGYLASLQVNAMVPQRFQPITAIDEVRGFVFGDHAGLIGPNDDDDLTSVGAGTYVALSKSVIFECAIGVPLTDRRSIGVGDLEAHFAVHFRPPVSRWLGWSS